MHRRTFVTGAAIGLGSLVLPRWVGAAAPAPRTADDPLKALAEEVLHEWCEGLLRSQIDNPTRPEQHGAFHCPACGILHGRCGEAVYPLLRVAKTTGEARFLEGAHRVVEWTRNVDSPDGAWTNEPQAPASWKGITVFGAIALAEAIDQHGGLLESAVRETWLRRLRLAAGFVHENFSMDYANINYPVTASYALALAGDIFGEENFRARGRTLARGSLPFLTRPNQLLFGEGQPRARLSAKGLHPIDLGYNVEESLPALAMYGLRTGDEEVLASVTAALAGHLEFMLPDGAWDNSWGTRSFKWSYWGSRTCDGCQPGYGLLAARDPAFGTAAYRNLQLLRSCTSRGLLHGGPHFIERGVPPCIHHTFCHAKALATLLDHSAARQPVDVAAPLPRETARGIREVPELASYLIAVGPWRATISGYDWLYKKDVFTGLGGALSLLWHRDHGPLFAASLTNYSRVEPFNMQPLPGGEDFCLTPRVEFREETRWFSNVFHPAAVVRPDESAHATWCRVEAQLVDHAQQPPASGPLSCQIAYRFTPEAVSVEVTMERGEIGRAPCTLVLPLISRPNEAVRRVSARQFEIRKAGGVAMIDSTHPVEIVDVPGGRVFNLVPGFCAIPFAVKLSAEGMTRVDISLRPS